MKRSLIFLLLSLVCFFKATAQLPPGTLLWSETWNGNWGPTNVNEYDFTGTYTLNNAELQYSSTQSCLLLVSGIPTGGCRSLTLHFRNFTDKDVVPVLLDGLCYQAKQTECFNDHCLEYIFENTDSKDFITIGFWRHTDIVNNYNYNDGIWIGEIELRVGEEPLPVPIISPESGSYTEEQNVTITCDASELPIYYVNHWGYWGNDGGLYATPITISSPTGISAYTYDNGDNNIYYFGYYLSQINYHFFNIIEPSFTANGVYYEIISFDDNTVRAIGLVDNNITTLTIPESVNYGNRVFTVTELDFPDEIGGKVTHLNLEPVFDYFSYHSCNVESLTIHCSDHAQIWLGWQSLESLWDDKPSCLKGTINHCKSIQIEGGSSLFVNGGCVYPELMKIVINVSGSCSLTGFNFCPQLTTLKLEGTFTMKSIFNPHFPYHPGLYSQENGYGLSPESFVFAPADTLIIGDVSCYCSPENGFDEYYIKAFPLDNNPDRTIIYTSDQGCYLYSYGDSLKTMTIPSNVKYLNSRCVKHANEIIIERGEPVSYCYPGVGSYMSNTEAKSVFFDRDASLSMLNGLTCKQLTIGEHVHTKGDNGTTTIVVRGDSAFVKVYQMEPPAWGNLFATNTYVNVPLYVPKGTSAAYSIADNWKNFFNIIEFDWEGPDYSIVVGIDHPEAGIVNGAGIYHWGDSVTLTAIPNEGWAFMGWNEEGTIISTNSTYTFVVDRVRMITAFFNEVTEIDETEYSKLDVHVIDGNIVITGANASSLVNVYNIQGQRIYRGSDKTINIATPGLYVVAVMNKAFKVIVE